MDRPKWETIAFTSETEIPALPSKEERLKQPSKEVFEADMGALDKQIDAVREQQKTLRAKRREVIDGGKIKGSNVTYREALTSKIKELKGVNDVKRKLQNQMKEASEALDGLDQEKRALLKVMHKEYHGVDEVRDAIKHLEYEQKTTSFKSAVEENKLIKEIETLKASIPKAERFSEIKPKVKEYNEKKKEIWGQLKEQKSIAAKHEVEIEGYRKEMEAHKEA